MRTPAFDNWVQRARAADIGGIIAKRGVKLKGRGADLAGPCPVCGGTDRFSINTKKQAFNCRGCGQGGYGAISLVRFLDGSDFIHAVEEITGEKPPQERTEDVVARERAVRAIWARRRPVEGSPAETYLRIARGYHGPIPGTFGYLPPNDKFDAALVAAFGFATEPEPGRLVIAADDVAGLCLIKLRPDGSGKIESKPGRPSKITIGLDIAAPIMIAPPNHLLGLAIVEGLENGLSVYAASGLGVWAAASCVNMPKLAPLVPDCIEVVNIVFDDDPAGRRYAIDLGQRLKARVANRKDRARFDIVFCNPNLRGRG